MSSFYCSTPNNEFIYYIQLSTYLSTYKLGMFVLYYPRVYYATEAFIFSSRYNSKFQFIHNFFSLVISYLFFDF